MLWVSILINSCYWLTFTYRGRLIEQLGGGSFNFNKAIILVISEKFFPNFAVAVHEVDPLGIGMFLLA
jgi:hypothetical protein